MTNLLKLSKAFGLIALLIGGVWTAQAQSVSISPSSTGAASYYCMPANHPGVQFQAVPANLNNGSTKGVVELYTWTATGGIDIDGASSGTISGEFLSSVTVKPKPDTDYANGYNKYAKGKLRVTIRVKHSYTYTYITNQGCTVPPQGEATGTYEYYVNYPAEIEIRKEFSDLTGNEITGPECVVAGQRVTYSVAPWVSMYQLNTVGFDDYQWTIPTGVAQNGVLYYSADYSSVTFIVGNNFAGKTIAVRMGACNFFTQTPVTLTLKAKPGAPALSNGSFAQGLCIDFGAGQQTLTITNPDPNNTYIWENLSGWAATPTVTLGNNNYTLTFTPQNDSRMLRLRVQGSCGEQVFDLQVNRRLSASNNQIQTVSGGTCVAPNTVTQFMVSNVGNNVPMTWTITDGAANGWYILPGTENLAQPHIMTGTGNATVSVVSAGCSGTITGTFGVAPKVPVINSATPVCTSNATQKFSVRQADAAVTYEWSYPSGWIVETTNANQSSITFTPDQTGGEVKVKATGANGCTSDWSDAIDVAAPLALKKVSQCVDAGLPGVIEVEIAGYDPDTQYGFPTIDDATFGTIDPAGIGANGIFKVNTTGKVGDFTVSVSGTNLCGDNATASLSYTVAKDPFTVQETVVMTTPLQISSFMILDQGYQDFDWRGDGTSIATVMPGVVDYVTNNVIVSNYSSVYVTVTNSATGCKTRKFRVVENGTPQFRSKAVNPTNSTPKAVNEFTVVDIVDGQDTAGQLTVYPNPASTELTVNLSSGGNINICIVSMSGSIVKESANQQPDTTIDVSALPAGNYLVVVLQGTTRYTKQFIKN